MNKRFGKISMLALAGALSIMSCRNIEPDTPITESDQGIGQTPVEGKINVQVNLLGTSFSSAKGTYGLSSTKPQTIVKELSPGNTIVAELTPTVSTFSDIVKGENLPKDYPYRVFVFDQEDRTLVDYKDFRVGEEKPASFTLDFEGNYIVVAYTDSSGKLPEFELNVPEESENKDKEIPTPLQEKTLDDINVGFSGSDVMYFKMENYSPAKIGNVVNITLMHRTSNITLNVKRMLYKEYVKDVVISQNNESGTINIGTGDIVNRTNPVEQNIDEKLTFDLPEGNVLSSLIPLNVENDFKLSLKIKQDNEFKNIELPFEVYLGTKYTLTLKKKYQCGAYVSKELWKEFMCHNLGANYDAHPINTIKELYGNKYARGVKEPTILHSEEANAVPKAPPASNAPIDAWQYDLKTENDPCPIGYRILKQIDIDEIFKHNKVEVLNSWTEKTPVLVRFGEDLILPMAGYRAYTSYDHIDRDVRGWYWMTSTGNANVFRIDNDGNTFYQQEADIFSFSIRCIADDSNVTVRPDIPKVGTGWDKEENVEVDIDKIIKDRKDKEKEAKKKKK